jgi:hypothetical protein
MATSTSTSTRVRNSRAPAIIVWATICSTSAAIERRRLDHQFIVNGVDDPRIAYRQASLSEADGSPA